MGSTKKSSKSTFKSDKTLLAEKIDETDEMKLKLLSFCSPESGDSLYPPELTAHLVEQINMMSNENGELRKCIVHKEQEITVLNKTVEDLNLRIRDIVSGCGPAISSKSAGVISAKLTELCKQNRHLVAEVESYKTRNSCLERKITQLEIKASQTNLPEQKEEPESNFDEMKELNNKLAVVNRKLYETKNKNLELKNDILVATKILQQELGDKFTSIKELQNDLAGWKGRAQQIALLQNRVSELEDKLSGKQREWNDSKRNNQNQIIRDIEMKRKRENEQTLKELINLRTENQELKKKIDGCKSRIRNLECDVTLTKQKLHTYAEKSNHDDLLVNEQRNQIKNLELYYQEILREDSYKIDTMNANMQEYQKQMSNSDAKIDALRKQGMDKSSKIDELRAQLKRYEECSLQSVFFTPMKTATDNEIRKLSELVNTLTARLDSERGNSNDLDSSVRSLKDSKRRLSKKVTALEEEVKNLKDRRTFPVSRTSMKGTQGSVEPTTTTRKRKESLFVSDLTTDELSSEESLNPEDLKFKLELAEEKMKLLEDRVKITEAEKCEDIANLTDMIQTSKKLFNEALAVLQKEKCICSPEI